MNVPSADIAAFISDRANNFGADNWQQVQYCASRFKNLPTEEVLNGLLAVFTEGAPPPSGSAAQELAGKLLMALAPSGNLNLEPLIRKILPRYELSVEQLPYHLANLFGKDTVYAVTQVLETENLTSTEHRALKTIQFWLRNQPSGDQKSPNSQKKSTVEIALAQAIHEIRLLLADCLGSENEAPMNVWQAAHLAYAFHNIALNTIQGEDADMSTVRPALEAMDKMLGSSFVNILDSSD